MNSHSGPITPVRGTQENAALQCFKIPAVASGALSPLGRGLVVLSKMRHCLFAALRGLRFSKAGNTSPAAAAACCRRKRNSAVIVVAVPGAARLCRRRRRLPLVAVHRRRCAQCLRRRARRRGRHTAPAARGAAGGARRRRSHRGRHRRRRRRSCRNQKLAVGQGREHEVQLVGLGHDLVADQQLHIRGPDWGCLCPSVLVHLVAEPAVVLLELRLAVGKAVPRHTSRIPQQAFPQDVAEQPQTAMPHHLCVHYLVAAEGV
mmetsp:Transcript_143128/g.457517  ORF Transcript_143128/g.457517 Transcript_143128/m.457517 type:complete len:261 (-) Transcript_143128:568-1350(-)